MNIIEHHYIIVINNINNVNNKTIFQGQSQWTPPQGTPGISTILDSNSTHKDFTANPGKEFVTKVETFNRHTKFRGTTK